MSAEKLQLYSLATPNGQKVSIALEEMELEYDAHKINILEGEQFADSFVKINPNSKIPALVDPVGDNGEPLAIMESGAILLYLAEKHQKFLPKSPADRSRVLQWLFFQVGGVGPMFGQFGHFYKYAKDKGDHPYPVKRYSEETKRLLEVMDGQLAQRDYLTGDTISIADFATAPWVMALDGFYEASEHLDLNSFDKVCSWVDRCNRRKGFQKGLKVCEI